ncbi:MAG: TIGR03086 family metal-binding protein [Acidimicrobiales bacterium]
MTASVDVLFDQGLDAFDAVVAGLPAEAWDRPTACEGWTSLDVLGHLGSSIAFGISVMEGEQPTWPEFDRPADLVTDEPVAYWRAIAGRARSALEGADLDLEMDTPMGRRTVADRLAFPAIDLYVHAWDIGSTAGIAVDVPDDVVELAHRHIDPLPEDAVRGPQGAFGPAVEPPPDATETERFLAWTGRDPRAARRP